MYFLELEHFSLLALENKGTIDLIDRLLEVKNHAELGLTQLEQMLKNRMIELFVHKDFIAL